MLLAKKKPWGRNKIKKNNKKEVEGMRGARGAPGLGFSGCSKEVEVLSSDAGWSPEEVGGCGVRFEPGKGELRFEAVHRARLAGTGNVPASNRAVIP